jgi:hypothetical protein
MKNSETESKPEESLPESRAGDNFQKVLDGRRQPIRGLWQRNKRFYARIAIENPNDGRKEVRPWLI